MSVNESHESQGPGVVEAILSAIRLMVIAVVLAIWSVVGFFLWLPFLTRMVAHFCGAITVSAFTNADVREAQNRLNFAIEFYVRGYKRIIGVLRRADSEEIQLKNIEPIDILHFLKSRAVDIIWTVVFWVLTVTFWNRIL